LQAILADLCTEYEDRSVAPPTSSPLDVLKFLMDQNGLRRADRFTLGYLASVERSAGNQQGARTPPRGSIPFIGRGFHLGLRAPCLIGDVQFPCQSIQPGVGGP